MFHSIRINKGDKTDLYLLFFIKTQNEGTPLKKYTQKYNEAEK